MPILGTLSNSTSSHIKVDLIYMSFSYLLLDLWPNLRKGSNKTLQWCRDELLGVS